YVRQYEDEVLLCVANLSRSAQAAEIDLSPWRGRVPHEMLGRSRFPRIGEGPYVITLAPYGFFWFQLREEPETSAEARPTVPPEFVTLVMSDELRSLLEGRTRASFEHEVLPPFLAGRRWFGDKGSAFVGASQQAGIPLDSGMMLALLDVTTGRGQSRYAVPLAVKWPRFDKVPSGPANILAAARPSPRQGTLAIQPTTSEFISSLLPPI